MPRARTPPSAWRTKLRPIFFPTVELWRDVEIQHKQIKAECDRQLAALTRRATQEEREAPVRRLHERVAQLAAALGQRADEIQETFGSTPFDPVPFSYLHPSPESPAATAPELALLLHWNRHSESLEAAYRKDTGPQLDAYDRIARTGRDYRHVVYGTPGLKPFKSDEIHSVLLQLIMALQIEPLTADERAACFEAYCPCGRRKGHDADALKKQDARLRKKLIASSSDSAP